MIKNICVLFIGFFIVFAQSPSTKDIEQKSTQLEKIRQEIENFKLSISTKSSEETKITKTIHDVEKNISLTSKLVRALSKENNSRQHEITQTENSISALAEQIGSLQSRLKKRIRRMYITGKMNTLELFLNRETSASTPAKMKYLKALALYDARLQTEVKSNMDEFSRKKENLQKLQTRKQALLKEKESNKKSLQNQRKEKNNLLAKIKNDKIALQKRLKEKEESAAQLATMIRELERQKREAELAGKSGKVSFVSSVPFNSMLGKLPWPAIGRIIAKFGTQKHPKHKTITENTGIDIGAKLGTPVKSVMDGKVATITFMRSFGNVILIDHGGGFYTVYAHVDDINVDVDTIVQAGDVIATVGDSGSIEGAKLHFAIWNSDQCMDPMLWLTK